MKEEPTLSSLTANDFKSGSIGHYEGFSMHSNKTITDSIQLPEEKTGKVPLRREERIRQLSELPNRNKDAFVPPANQIFKLGPYVYRVAVRNVGSMRFTAVLHDVIVEGVND